MASLAQNDHKTRSISALATMQRSTVSNQSCRHNSHLNSSYIPGIVQIYEEEV